MVKRLAAFLCPPAGDSTRAWVAVVRRLQGAARETTYALASTRSSGMIPSCVIIDAESKYVWMERILPFRIS